MRLSFVGFMEGWGTDSLDEARDIVEHRLNLLLEPADLGPAIRKVIIGLICMTPSPLWRTTNSRLYVTDKPKTIINRLIGSPIDVSYEADQRIVLSHEEVRQMTVEQCVLLLFQKLKEFADALLKFRRKIDFDRQGFKDLILQAEQAFLQEIAAPPPPA